MKRLFTWMILYDSTCLGRPAGYFPRSVGTDAARAGLGSKHPHLHTAVFGMYRFSYVGVDLVASGRCFVMKSGIHVRSCTPAGPERLSHRTRHQEGFLAGCIRRFSGTCRRRESNKSPLPTGMSLTNSNQPRSCRAGGRAPRSADN